MKKVNFQIEEIKVSARNTGKCRHCGKPADRRKTFVQRFIAGKEFDYDKHIAKMNELKENFESQINCHEKCQQLYNLFILGQ